MSDRGADWRRQLSRALTRRLTMRVGDILADAAPASGRAQRTGFTWPPGAGKSSLIAALARLRLARNRNVGVLAIDPSSPVSHGSLLGDRIRMDAIDDDRFFLRSLPSGTAHDGLCRNLSGLLGTMEEFSFDDVLLETVGVGQVSYEARAHVDTLVLVLVPESGDTIQAMKAGIMEMADIYVVNKSDRLGAERAAAGLRSVFGSGRAGEGAPPVVIASAQGGVGIEALDAAIDAHFAGRSHADRATRAVERQRSRLRALLQQRFDELLRDDPGWMEMDAAAAFRQLARKAVG